MNSFIIILGELQAITMKIDENTQIRGSNAWLLTVIVTSPNGLLAQTGGYEYRYRSDRFYSRRWPDPWIGQIIGTSTLDSQTNSNDWISTRDVSAAGLSSINNHNNKNQKKMNDNNNEWKVELAIGYMLSPRLPVNYTGMITLYFKPLNTDNNNSINNQTNNQPISVDPHPNPNPIEPINIDNPNHSNSDSNSMNHLTQKWLNPFKIIGLLLLISLFIFLCVIIWNQCNNRLKRESNYKRYVAITDEATGLLALSQQNNHPMNTGYGGL